LQAGLAQAVDTFYNLWLLERTCVVVVGTPVKFATAVSGVVGSSLASSLEAVCWCAPTMLSSRHAITATALENMVGWLLVLKTKRELWCCEMKNPFTPQQLLTTFQLMLPLALSVSRF
jgi:hypothetical protein